MSPVEIRSTPPPLRLGSRGLLAWICTSNPFYVLSALLFLAGLRLSFGAADEVEAYALMSGLGGYTLLLAVTAFLLVRFARVWDDARTVLLLVVLMFLATSVTVDEFLVQSPSRGQLLSLAGLSFAIAVSESLLRGSRLALPVLFRLPYYLILSLFFLYPLTLSSLVDRPKNEFLLWGLFGFATMAGLVFLTLLPAIRRGPDYLHENGSPWQWPLYPWTLFGLLACAVPARAFLLCWSMHLLQNAEAGTLVFGLYFLVPFGLALCVLLLEIGLVSESPGLLRLTLILPAGLVMLAILGHRPDAIYQHFVEVLLRRLGGDPLYLTVIGVGLFYAYAASRRVYLAAEAFTGVLFALAFLRPEALRQPTMQLYQPELILLASGLQLALGLWRRNSVHCLVAASCLLVAANYTIAAGLLPELRGAILIHLFWLMLMIIGATLNDEIAEVLRYLAPPLGVSLCIIVLFGIDTTPMGLPAWVL
ncbi:MAG: hypothetical protein AB7K24_15300, partial [Gemmataceae bacterium]